MIRVLVNSSIDDDDLGKLINLLKKENGTIIFNKKILTEIKDDTNEDELFNIIKKSLATGMNGFIIDRQYSENIDPKLLMKQQKEGGAPEEKSTFYKTAADPNEWAAVQYAKDPSKMTTAARNVGKHPALTAARGLDIHGQVVGDVGQVMSAIPLLSEVGKPLKKLSNIEHRASRRIYQNL